MSLGRHLPPLSARGRALRRSVAQRDRLAEQLIKEGNALVNHGLHLLHLLDNPAEGARWPVDALRPVLAIPQVVVASALGLTYSLSVSDSLSVSNSLGVSN